MIQSQYYSKTGCDGMDMCCKKKTRKLAGRMP